MPIQPTIVEVNGQEIEFPGDMHPDDIAAVLRKQFPTPQAAQPQATAGRTMLDQGLQGATFGFSDEISDSIASTALGALDKDRTALDYYKEARQNSASRLDGQLEQRPLTSIASNLAGGVLTGAAGLSTKAGSAVSNSLRSGNLPARIAKGALAGATSGAAYGTGSAQDNERTQGAQRGAVLGAAFGGTIPVVGQVASRINTRVVYPTAEKVKAASRQLYKEAAEIGGEFSPSVLDDVYKAGSNFLPKGDIAKQLIKPDAADDFALSLKGQLGKKLSLDDFESIDRDLGEKAHAAFLNNPALSRKYSAMQSSLRDSIENPSNIIGSAEGIAKQREAVKLWATSSKMNDIERILRDAEYYDVPATAIKTGFRRIARNDKLLRGYSSAEQHAIRRAAKTGALEGVFKTFGSRLMSIGGGSVGGVNGAVIGHGISTGGRAVSESIKKGQASKVERLLGQRSGLTQTEKRISAEKLKQIMKMKPKDALNVLEGL